MNLKRTMKLVCTGFTDDHYHFVFTDHENGEKTFSLTKEEILEVKDAEYNVLPNRYQFGFIEPAIGKMVVALHLLYWFDYLPRKSIELGED